LIPIAALIEFPQASTLALWIVASIAVGMFGILIGNEYFKKASQTRNRSRIQLQAIDDIFEDKKLSDEEIHLMNEVLHHHATDNPLRAVTTREGFGDCVQAEMERVTHLGVSGVAQNVGVKLRDIRVALGLDYVPVGKPIYSSRELHAGQAINVSIKGDNSGRKTRMILKGVDEAYLYASPETSTTGPKYKDGTEVSLELWRDEDGRYTFDSRIVYYGTHHAEWRIGHNTKKMERTQDREHFRMRFDQTANIGILNASMHEELSYLRQRKQVAQLRGKITSLSAGGCAIVFQQPIAKNVFLRVEIELPDMPAFSLDAKIIATSNISGGRSLIRTRFLQVEEEEKDLISRYLLKKQQETLANTAEG
jgi:c-di-GMP-binding flagellar brake protein YcgR